MCNKNNNIQIFIFGHKDLDYGYWDNELYTPLEVGADFHDTPSIKLKDNIGDNISNWNQAYAETTGIYWIWKHLNDNLENFNINFNQLNYIGQCQYRRRLNFPINTDFDKLFNQYDIILPKPISLGHSIENHYKLCHNIEDINFAEQIVNDLFLEYKDDWNKYIKQNDMLYNSSGMIMKKNDYKNYCKWVFSIFDEFKIRKSFNNPQDIENYVKNNIALNKNNNIKGLRYQTQLFGFLQERLMTLYVKHNFNKILEIDYTKFEGLEI